MLSEKLLISNKCCAYSGVVVMSCGTCVSVSLVVMRSNLVRHLQEAGDKLSGFSVCSQDTAGHAARTVVRCLALATNAVHCVEVRSA